jgi:hypothetical protein
MSTKRTAVRSAWWAHFAKRYAGVVGAVGIAGVVFALLAYVQGTWFSSLSNVEKLVFLAAAIALSIASITAFGAWHDGRRFAVTTSLVVLALVALFGLSALTLSDTRSSASAAPPSGTPTIVPTSSGSSPSPVNSLAPLGGYNDFRMTVSCNSRDSKLTIDAVFGSFYYGQHINFYFDDDPTIASFIDPVPDTGRIQSSVVDFTWYAQAHNKVPAKVLVKRANGGGAVAAAALTQCSS